MAKHALADTYRAEREELLALASTLGEDQAGVKTSACPAWSIKDVYAHLAGISSDILVGNTEGAATEAWADGHVAARLEHSLAQVLDEWGTAGSGVSEIMDEAGELFPFQLFVDQWTHGWDIRAAIGDVAAATPDMSTYEYFLDEFFANMQRRIPGDLPGLELSLAGRNFVMGNEPAIGTLDMSLFEYARISMGRRSRAQLDELPWPQAVSDPAPYIDVLVVWSVNSADVVDPMPS